MNCWEYFKCGCGPGGEKAAEAGECPAATDCSLDGTNRGVNGGRSCWRVTGTMCSAEVHGDATDKMMECFKCEFLKKVREEEGEDFKYIL